MILPNADSATINICKLRNYCLNPDHGTGKHKARLFMAAFGMAMDDAEALRDILLEAVKTENAILGKRDAFGQRYTVDFEMTWNDRTAIVRSGWIIEDGSTAPRLTTCFPK